MKTRFALLATIAMLLALPLTAAAVNSIGVLCWQPGQFEVVCFDVENRSDFAFNLTGWHHVHTSTSEFKLPVSGSAIYDSSANLIRLQWDIGSGDLYAYAATILPDTLSGTWFRSGGDSGNFIFIGPGPQ